MTFFLATTLISGVISLAKFENASSQIREPLKTSSFQFLLDNRPFLNYFSATIWLSSQKLDPERLLTKQGDEDRTHGDQSGAEGDWPRKLFTKKNYSQ